MAGEVNSDPPPDPLAALDRLAAARGDSPGERWAALPACDDPDTWHIYNIHSGEPPDDFAGGLLGTFYGTDPKGCASFVAAARDLPAAAIAAELRGLREAVAKMIDRLIGDARDTEEYEYHEIDWYCFDPDGDEWPVERFATRAECVAFLCNKFGLAGAALAAGRGSGESRGDG